MPLEKKEKKDKKTSKADIFRERHFPHLKRLAKGTTVTVKLKKDDVRGFLVINLGGRKTSVGSSTQQASRRGTALHASITGG